MEPMAQLRSEEDLQLLLSSAAPRLVVVDFFATWCGPCKMVAPAYAELSHRFAQVARFAKVDVDAAPDLAAFARVRAMPTFQVYSKGKCVLEVKGADLGRVEKELIDRGMQLQQEWLSSVCNDPMPAPSAEASIVLPHSTLLRFEKGDLSKISKKLLQSGKELQQLDDEHALNAVEFTALSALLKSMENSNFSPSAELVPLTSRLCRWPPAHRFAIFDLLRLALCRRHAAEQLSTADHVLADQPSLLEQVREFGLCAGAGEVNHMLALRFFTNLLASLPEGSRVDRGLSLIPAVLEAAAVADVHSSAREGARLALSSLLLNAAVLLHAERADSEMKTPSVCALLQLLSMPQSCAEVLRRALLALGTLLHEDVPTALLCLNLEVGTALQAIVEDETQTAAVRSNVTQVLQLIESQQGHS